MLQLLFPFGGGALEHKFDDEFAQGIVEAATGSSQRKKVAAALTSLLLWSYLKAFLCTANKYS